MNDTRPGTAAGLTDDELLRRVNLLAREERGATVELVAHLAELDTRQLHLAQGYGSLFGYCTGALCLAEHAAYNRIEAARASRKFPGILDRLAEGSLNLSTVRLLAPHLTPQNHQSVLDEAARKSKREVEALVARLAPRPDVPASVRKLPPPRHLLQAPAAAFAVGAPAPAAASLIDAAATVPAASATAAGAGTGLEAAEGTAAVAAIESAEAACNDGGAAAGTCGSPASRPPLLGLPAAPAATSGTRHLVVPLSPERYRMQFTVGPETHGNLRRAQELLRREIPDGDPGAIFDRALKLLLEDVARKKLAATSKPRPARAAPTRSRFIPAHVKRAVWLRDGGQCAFVARSGRRCRERSILEFHHVEPYAFGGETTVANLSLRCRAHNAHDSERVFGPFVPAARASAGGSTASRTTRPGAS